MDEFICDFDEKCRHISNERNGDQRENRGRLGPRSGGSYSFSSVIISGRKLEVKYWGLW